MNARTIIDEATDPARHISSFKKSSYQFRKFTARQRCDVVLGGLLDAVNAATDSTLTSRRARSHLSIDRREYPDSTLYVENVAAIDDNTIMMFLSGYIGASAYDIGVVRFPADIYGTPEWDQRITDMAAAIAETLTSGEESLEAFRNLFASLDEHEWFTGDFQSMDDYD